MRRCTTIALVLATAVLGAIVPASAAHAASCAGADSSPHDLTVSQARAATVCLLNVERGRRGLAPLRHNDGLALAGQRHARDMVRRRYFSHVSRAGTPFSTRIKRTGYLRGAGRALLGENLAWGSGRLATPRQIVRTWMRSPGHRANILKPAFREVGIGVVRARPAGTNGATYAAEFGRRY
ncbi:MAG TPA: CAP domain-containing protein [Solirubrobacteraceae bacterium]|nr:CAP domain-containing protein [Solirubrobacteraceae bacterium]